LNYITRNQNGLSLYIDERVAQAVMNAIGTKQLEHFAALILNGYPIPGIIQPT